MSAFSSLMASVVLTVLAQGASEINASPILNGEQSFGQPGDMMEAYVRARTSEAAVAWRERFERIATEADVRAYQEMQRAFFLESLGGFPERTPLNARVVERSTHDGFRLEKIIYESRPGFYVTAALFLPVSEGPYPGILFPCGHSANGKAAETYQRAAILLARNGLAALVYDPIGQGERYQILDEQGGRVFGSTLEHTLTGVGSILLGTNTATYRIWDGIRGIDYLQSRDDIITDKIGCTGNSGGGTLTSYIMALDDRVVCAAPSCYLTSFERLIHTIGAQDAEQDIYGQIAFGMDHADYVIMRAPKPTLLCAATHDFFDIEGTWDTFRHAKRTYTRLNYPERVSLVETDAEHGFSKQLREGAVAWMRRWLLDIDGPVSEPDFDILTDEQLQCTASGQVLLEEGARSVFELNAELEAEYAEARAEAWADSEPDTMRERIREVTGIRPYDDVEAPAVTRLQMVRKQGYRIEKIVLTPEPGIVLPVLLLLPDTMAGGRVYLYLNGNGYAEEAGDDGEILKLVRAGHAVAAVDVRSLGETAPGDRTLGGFEVFAGRDWPNVLSVYMLRSSFVAMRTEDIYATMRFLEKSPWLANPADLHLLAVGETTVPALHAAALESEYFASVTLREGIDTWAEVVRTPSSRNQLVNTVHGALKVYDLPNLRSLIGEDVLSVESPASAGAPMRAPNAPN